MLRALLLSDLGVVGTGDSLLLHGLFQVPRDDDGHAPPPGSEDVGVPYCAGIDAQATDHSVFAHLLWLSVLRRPMPHLPAACVINAADDTKDIENEEGSRLSLHSRWKELSLL